MTSEGKVCRGCGLFQLREQFGVQRVNGRAYFQSRCKSCERLRAKRDYPRRAESIKAWQRNNPDRRRAAKRRWLAKNGDISREQNRRANRKLRDDIMRAYGGEVPTCQCCGETTPAFLALDHIARNGAADRRLHGGSSRRSYALFRSLRRRGYPPGYQVLCHNCNVGRERHDGVCPHKLASPQVGA